MGGRSDPWRIAETGYPGVQTHYPEIPAESKDNTQSEPNLGHLTVVYDWLFRAYYIFVVMELKTRRIVQVAVTQSPSDEWTAQQLREATPWGKGPKFLLHDLDSMYGIRFSSVAAGSGIAELRTPYRAPRANGVCERFMGSLRRECLDHMLILHGKHLQRVVKEYTTYFNQDRPH
jgi:putative transposase